MTTSLEIVRQILSHRLHHSDIRRILGSLTKADQEEFLAVLAEVLEKVAAILEVSSRMGDSQSLDNLLALMVEISADAVRAERGTLFLNDAETDELLSRVIQGDGVTEIRFPNSQGIAGSVFRSGQPIIIAQAYSDTRFNQEIDRQTGFRTRNILCAPIRTAGGRIIGVIELLNKADGDFREDDLSLLENISLQAATALQNAQLYEQIQRVKREETHLLAVTTAISSELHLKPLLQKIMESTVTILEADRSTLFLYDDKTGELWSSVALGMQNREIRIPASAGIAGSVFATGETINIPEAYKDTRFNQDIDRRTGYHTRSILCMPVINRFGKTIGVTQVLNKRGGAFNRHDERKLKAFSSQVAVAIENAKLFDEVLTMKNYNESILDSLSTGVVTLNASRRVETANPAALRTLSVDGSRIVGKQAEEVFAGPNDWVNRSIHQVLASGRPDLAMEAELIVAEDRAVSVNFTDLPLLNPQKETIGAILMLDDITQEKRLRGALSRYMPKEIADRLLDADAVLGGQIQEVSVLFSDIRSFTTISEALGPQETVAMLNEYFTVMADIIFRQGGILDKYIGDAILALFGTPFPTGEDADHAVTVAVEMQQALVEFNQHRRRQQKDAIRVGIGVNTDAVLVGNIGCLKRMDYTVIGDGVNLASRLEGASKFYRADVLISDMTFRQLKRPYFCREVDLIRVKGKHHPVLVHEIFTPPPEAERSRLTDFLGQFAEALRFYRRREFGLAQDLFGKATALRGEDHLSALYRERCAYFLSTPPEAAWDGVWTMKEK